VFDHTSQGNLYPHSIEIANKKYFFS